MPVCNYVPVADARSEDHRPAQSITNRQGQDDSNRHYQNTFLH
jgi:hypothetical protein